MFKISDFSKLSQVSMRTLRYYDEIGLLKPVHVDPDSGYRYYSIDQLSDLHRIIAFKDLGFELAQIMQLLNEEVPTAQIRGMLRIKQIELQQRLQAEQEKLDRVEARLKQIETTNTRLTHEVTIKKVKPQIVALSRLVVADSRLKKQLADEMVQLLRQNDVKQTDALLYIEHEQNDGETVQSSVDIAVPVQSATVGNIVERSGGRVTIRELPGVNMMASLIHYGNPFAMIEAYQAIATWIQLHEYAIVGPCRTICLRWEGELETYITEIQFPIEKNDKVGIPKIFG